MGSSRWLLVLTVVFCAGSVSAESPGRTSDFLRLPPAFRALAGDPVIELEPADQHERKGRLKGAGPFSPKFGFREQSRDSRLFLQVKEGADEKTIAENAARTFAEAFHEKVLSRENRNWHERRLGIDQLLIPQKDRFVDLAERKLLGQSAQEPWLDAWWKVRMGLPQTPDRSHHLVLINLHYDHFGEKTTNGHFCFALRKNGGDSEGDILFDFRAPWSLDRPPRFTEGLNLHNRLLLSATVENLYDWLYTQNEYRHCYVDCWFLPVSEEQVALLRHIADRPVIHEAGQFRAFRKNCASLGLGFLHRLEPIGTPLPLGRGVADIPTVAARRILDDLEEEPPYFRLENVTYERDREPTAKSTIHRAEPSRRDSRAFRLLRSVPGVN